MLPLSLLRAAENSPMLVELKSGETYNGRLLNCDSWMNINLKDVICTSADGTRFWKLPECYIRGSSIKYLRLPEDVADRVPEDDVSKHSGRGRGGGGGGGRYGSSGRGRIGGRGRGSGGDGRGRSSRGGGRGNQYQGRGRGRAGRY